MDYIRIAQNGKTKTVKAEDFLYEISTTRVVFFPEFRDIELSNEKKLGHEGAFLLSVALHLWSKFGKKSFYQPQSVFMDLSGLTRKKVSAYLKELSKIGIVSIEKKGMPAVFHYNIDLKILIGYIVNTIELKNVESIEFPPGFVDSNNEKSPEKDSSQCGQFVHTRVVNLSTQEWSICPHKSGQFDHAIKSPKRIHKKNPERETESRSNLRISASDFELLPEIKMHFEKFQKKFSEMYGDSFQLTKKDDLEALEWLSRTSLDEFSRRLDMFERKSRGGNDFWRSVLLSPRNIKKFWNELLEGSNIVTGQYSGDLTELPPDWE